MHSPDRSHCTRYAFPRSVITALVALLVIRHVHLLLFMRKQRLMSEKKNNTIRIQFVLLPTIILLLFVCLARISLDHFIDDSLYRSNEFVSIVLTMANLEEDLSRMSIGDDSSNKFGRKDKFPREVEIYRPGSGPLKRSGNSRQDVEDDDKRSGFDRDLESLKKSDFIPNKHFENPSRKKENFPRGQKMNGIPADNYSTFNLKRKQPKKTQLYYEPPNEWSNDKRPDRPRVNFVNPNDSKNDDENWRTHKAPTVVIVPKVVKKIDEKPAVSEKIISPGDIIPTMIINTRVNTIQNIPDKTSGFSNKKREEKKVPSKPIHTALLMNYEKLPPRLRRKFCDDYHISMEEVETLLTNGLPSQDELNKQNSSYHSRSQTLPPRSGKGRFNEPQRHEQGFYRINSNQPPPKTEMRRQQSTVVNSSTESSRRGVDFDLPTKVYNSYHESKIVNHNTRDDTENNFSVSVKQSIESAVLLPSGTINWAEEVERAENMFKVAEDSKKEVERLETVDKTLNSPRDRRQRKSVSKDRNCVNTLPLRDQPSSSAYSNWHSQSNDNSESLNSNGGSWRKEKSKSIRNCSNDRSRNRSRNRKNRNNSEKSAPHKSENVGGIIKLPPNVNVNSTDSKSLSLSGYLNKTVTATTSQSSYPAKQLYNHNNPNKPIVIPPKQQNVRAGYPPANVEPHHAKEHFPMNVNNTNAQQYSGAHYGSAPPAWYDPYTESYRASIYPVLLLDIKKADSIIGNLVFEQNLLQNWPIINSCREFLKDSLKELLKSDMKFCQRENIETHFWKILYHNIIEHLKKLINEDLPELVKDYTTLLMNLIEEGMKYMNDLLKLLEKHYNFNLDDYVSLTCLSTKKLGNVGLALISSQKLYISLGDLARYKDIMNHSTNYVIAKQWYTKANQINPKNGRPYNQLALLAVYEKRKLDAVYYYMRSLMASNPFQSAKDSLLSLFEEYRRKYEMTDRKRLEDRERREREKAKEKESSMSSKEKYSKRRKEIWIHPDGRKRSHRTTSSTEPNQDIDEDELSKLSQSEVNKRFIVSFLHVHGKLFTKVGMESFQDTALQMLREFRKLLSNTPIPIITTRFLQYLALNMFSIEYSRPKETHVEQGYWSTVHECALAMSLQMFSLIVDRCNQLLKEILNKDGSTAKQLIGSDIDFLLPPIKVWCDWLLCNSKVWNPPPSCSDYKLSGTGDCWCRLASLVNNLEKFQEHYKLVLNEPDESDPNLKQQLKLPEDSMFSGFTPIIGYELKPVFITTTSDRDLSELTHRVNCILFFGTEFLCGTEPPVFKLHKTDTGASEYISVVETASPKDDSEDEEMCFESWIDEDNDLKSRPSEDRSVSELQAKPISNEIQKLLSRKEELEQKQRIEELRQKRVQEILKQASYCIEIEIKPHYVVPDTNCFIDYLPQLEKLIYSLSHAQEHTCTLMIPTVVLIELEGLAKGGWVRDTVCDAAKQALKILKNIDSAAVKFVTTKGSSFKSTTCFEEENNFVGNNDDKILATCLSLCKNNSQLSIDNQLVEGEPKKIFRDVVLLTEDRNLRVKALSSDMPVRAVMDFINWLNFISS